MIRFPPPLMLSVTEVGAPDSKQASISDTSTFAVGPAAVNQQLSIPDNWTFEVADAEIVKSASAAAGAINTTAAAQTSARSPRVTRGFIPTLRRSSVLAIWVTWPYRRFRSLRQYPQPKSTSALLTPQRYR
jgi:hypothetical protein